MVLSRIKSTLRDAKNLTLEKMEDRHLLSTVPFAQKVEIGPDIYHPSLITNLSLNDLDADGDLDLTFQNSGDYAETNGLSWRLNAGDGTFGELQFESPHDHSKIRPITLADIDGDGDDDVVRGLGNDAFWFENRLSDGGSVGGESRSIDIINAEIPSSILGVGDFNGDGRDDLVTGNGWAQNLGEARFREHALAGQVDVRESTVIDVDADGDLDLVQQTGFLLGRVSILENVGGDTVFADPKISDWEFNRRVLDFEPHDVDHDGDLDLLAVETSRDGSVVRWAENTNNELELKILREVETGEPLPARAYLQLDISGDGLSDVVFRSNGGNLRFWWYDDIQSSSWNPLDFPEFQFTATGDIDNDGDMDWVGASVNGEVVWFDGVEDMSESHEVAKSEPNILHSLSATDFDGDGDSDLVFNLKNGVSWLRNEDGQNFAPAETLVEPAGGNRVSVDIKVVDLSGDGLADLVRSVRKANGVPTNVWHQNLGNGVLDAATALPELNSFDFLDIDGDGDQDLRDKATSNNVVYLNDGNGTFTETLDVVGSNLSAADVDDDGDLDLVSTAITGISWFENLGDNSYGDSISITTDATLGQIADAIVFDADNDGDADILAARRSTGSFLDSTQVFQVFENQGGEFTLAQEVAHSSVLIGQQVTTGGSFNGFTTADLDSDGDLDLLSKTVYFENVGGLQFESPRRVDAEFGVGNLVPADLNGDGSVDLAGIKGDRVIWYRNRLDTRPRSISQVDIDQLFAAIQTGSSDPNFDWNQDENVNVADVDYLIEEVIGARRGDLNIDGRVDFIDFLELSERFGQEDVGWADGDLDGDRTVGFADFLLLSLNFNWISE